MLENQTVRYTPLQELNDPAESPMFNGDGKFEANARAKLLRIPDLDKDEREGAALFLASRNILSQTMISARKWGVLCLSGPDALTHSPMWSHYADGHKGVAIGLDSMSKALQGFGGLKSVSYGGPRRPSLEAFNHKLDCWNHEHEYRAFKLLHPGSATASAGPALFETFDPTDVVDIVLGSRCEAETWRFIVRWLANHGLASVNVRHCVMSSSGQLSVISVIPTAVESFFNAEARMKDDFTADDNRQWQMMWSTVGGMKARTSP